MDPIATGDYPHSMRSLVRERLPKFSSDQSIMLNGSFDFIGVNYYTSRYAAYAPHSNAEKPSYNTDARAKQLGKYTICI